VSRGSGLEKPALVAIDLGAESCRVSLLRRHGHESPILGPRISMVRRFANAPQDDGAAGWHWDLERICSELEAGLRACADLAPEGIASIGVTGWAVESHWRRRFATATNEPRPRWKRSTPFCRQKSCTP